MIKYRQELDAAREARLSVGRNHKKGILYHCMLSVRTVNSGHVRTGKKKDKKDKKDKKGKKEKKSK